MPITGEKEKKKRTIWDLPPYFVLQGRAPKSATKKKVLCFVYYRGGKEEGEKK